MEKSKQSPMRQSRTPEGDTRCVGYWSGFANGWYSRYAATKRAHDGRSYSSV